MKTITFAAAFALAGTIASAHGATLAAAPIYGGPNAASELCEVTNYSPSAVTLTGVTVTDDTGQTSLVLVQNTCTGSLPSGASCRYMANIPQPPSAGYTCMAATDADAKTIAGMRMTNEALDINATGLFNEAGH